MSERAEERRLTLIGLALVSCLLVVVTVIAINPFAGRPANQISVVIDLPYLGQGVTTGTAMTMHGVKVGEVTSVASLPNGSVRLNAEFNQRPTAALTDSLGLDFRPANYFGVTAAIGSWHRRPATARRHENCHGAQRKLDAAGAALPSWRDNRRGRQPQWSA